MDIAEDPMAKGTHTSDHPLVACLKHAFAEASDPVRAKGARAYMKSEMPFYGLDARTMRAIQKQCWGANPLAGHDELVEVVQQLWDGADYREERYAAQETLRRYLKFLSTDDLPLFRHLVVTGAWWDHVDMLAKWVLGGVLERDPGVRRTVLRDWIRDEDLWVRRSAILAQLAQKEKTDSGLLFSLCDSTLEETSFWIRKAVGWALREYAKTDEAAVKQFVLTHRDRMSGLSFREATKHITLTEKNE